MNYDNSYTLRKISKAPERIVPKDGGDAYVRFSMACDNGKDRPATFVNVSAFGRRGDVIMQYFTKETASLRTCGILNRPHMSEMTAKPGRR